MCRLTRATVSFAADPQTRKPRRALGPARDAPQIGAAQAAGHQRQRRRAHRDAARSRRSPARACRCQDHHDLRNLFLLVSGAAVFGQDHDLDDPMASALRAESLLLLDHAPPPSPSARIDALLRPRGRAEAVSPHGRGRASWSPTPASCSASAARTYRSSQRYPSRAATETLTCRRSLSRVPDYSPAQLRPGDRGQDEPERGEQDRIEVRAAAREAPPGSKCGQRAGPARQGAPEAVRGVLGSARAGGAGLGLAIAAELVRAHGGTLIVPVESGRGATFRHHDFRQRRSRGLRVSAGGRSAIDGEEPPVASERDSGARYRARCLRGDDLRHRPRRDRGRKPSHDPRPCASAHPAVERIAAKAGGLRSVDLDRDDGGTRTLHWAARRDLGGARLLPLARASGVGVTPTLAAIAAPHIHEKGNQAVAAAIDERHGKDPFPALSARGRTMVDARCVPTAMPRARSAAAW